MKKIKEHNPLQIQRKQIIPQTSLSLTGIELDAVSSPVQQSSVGLIIAQ